MPTPSEKRQLPETGLTRCFSRIFNVFIFSSLYIAGCAVVMADQANQLLHLDYDIRHYLLFVFYSTVCSYNFHWYLTPGIENEMIRVRWTRQHKTLHLVLCCIGLAGSGWHFFYFTGHWFWMSGAALLTFLYSAPKLPVHPFKQLQKIAVGKTIFLAFVWTYVTSVLPIILDGNGWHMQHVLFCVSRLSLIYSICVIFDYRDRQQDQQQGIRSLITYLSETGINRLFYGTITLFIIITACLLLTGFSLLVVVMLLIPGVITLCLYQTARKNFSDYLYYVVLDGLMALSALLTLLIQ